MKDRVLTLADFKRNSKFIAIFVFLTIWALTFYQLGRHATIGEFFKVRESENQNEKNKQVEIPEPYADSQTGSIISSSVKLCSNTFYGFELAYPADWFTTYNTDNQKCTFFAPYSFVVPEQTDKTFVPIKIEVVKIEEWPSTVKFFENPNDFQNIISVQNIDINGKSVKKIKAISTGAGNIQQGFDKLSFLVLDPKNPLILSYQQLDKNENTSLSEGVLEDMTNNLKYF